MDMLKKTYTRAKQTVEEKFGEAAHTEYEPEFQNLLNRADDIKNYTSKILSAMEIYLQPDPAIRIMPGLTQEGLNKAETVGAEMGHLATKLGTENGYGAALHAGSDAFSKVGGFEREMLSQANQQYFIPVKRFINEDLKELDNEKKALNNRRLDMDSLKTKSAKSQGNATLQQDLEKSDAAFKEQETKVRELIKKAEEQLPELQKHLKNLIALRLEFLKKSVDTIEELQKKV